MKPLHRTLILWMLIFLVLVAFYQYVTPREQVPEEKNYTAFTKAVEAGLVKDVLIRGEIYEGHMREGDKPFRVNGPVGTSEVAERWAAKNVDVRFENHDQANWIGIALQIIPIGLVVLLFLFLMRQVQSGGGKAMSFGKSKARLLSESHNKVTFANVAGIDEAREELEEIIDFLKEPKKFTKLGGRIPKGVLLMGSPGTGKTLIAKAVAGEAGVPFFSISGSDFVEMFVGVGASRVRDLFEQGKKNAPCIIFIDEIDAVGRHRGAGLGGGHDEREQTLNQLLVEMDGFESNDGVIIIAATNRPDVLDPALLRPGRFDRRIVVPRPDVRGREGILKVHTTKMPLNDVDLNTIARGTPGFSGADLENLVNEAALNAARLNKDRLDSRDFEFAKDKVLMGSERRSLVMSEKERRNTAIHESGHTIVARMLPNCDPIHKVTIMPRGRALGVTQTLPIEDKLSYYKAAALDTISMMMGGRIAEEIVFGEMSSGASNDIERATQLARAMVCEWGMSEKLGPLAYGKGDEEVFLGRQMGASQKDYSEATAIEIDSEVRRIVTAQYDRAKAILIDKRDVLEKMGEALMQYETLDRSDVEVIMTGGLLTRERPVAKPVNTTAPKPKEDRPKKPFLDAFESLGKPPEPSKA